jgi:deoxycytidine triphosphate deaminase
MPWPMILSDRTLSSLIQSGQLTVEPLTAESIQPA